ncbi:glycosyltransferase family 4 protein [Tropicimonas sp. IMCC34011]|uniref:glycosyltransferase family 4 protein n=1 Tax=Tropicimonas sp. IMCC34011 TaxID=2248759 RepID=UPI001E5155BC|nr:glycosyltransferase family 4 protein [Tropicimonas sp. IMCC34011]
MTEQSAGPNDGRPLRIALLAHLRHPIAPPFMGGMEAHSWHLCRALIARGHDVTLFASGDSDPALPLSAICDVHYDAVLPWRDHHGTDRLNAWLDDAHAAALERIGAGGFDVVHNNGLHRYPPRWARVTRHPMVTSLHVPPFNPLDRVARDSGAPFAPFTITSRVQSGRYWPDGRPDWAHVVPNGIDPADWPYSPVGDGTAVWFGRIAPNKGPHLAAEAARIAGIPLTLFGAIEDPDYFQSAVRPHLGDAVRYGGHLSGADLARRIGRASVCLATPLWDEPFGLTAIESLACGTPVAATDMGAMREVLGPCGTFAPPDDPGALASAMTAALRIDRAACRARVEERFTAEAMTRAYERLYRSAIAARHAGWPDATFPPCELRPALAAQRGMVARRGAAPDPGVFAEK